MYDREKIIEQAIQIIEEEQITKISELAGLLPISRATFYGWELDKLEVLAQKIEDTKISIKRKMKKKWADCGVPALEIARYKLLADDDEMERLTVSKVKQESKLTFENLPKVTLLDAGNQGTEDQDI